MAPIAWSCQVGAPKPPQESRLPATPSFASVSLPSPPTSATALSQAPSAIGPSSEGELPDEEPNTEDLPNTLPLASAWAKDRFKALHHNVARCAEVVGFSESAQDCTVSVVGLGNGIVVTIVVECGGDSCSLKRWLLRENAQTPMPVPFSAEGGFAFDRTLSFYVRDDRSFHSDADMHANFYTRMPMLVRVELQTGQTKPFARCFSPTLSPGGDWFLCRNRQGDVLKTPAQGGKTETVAKNQTKGPIEFSPYAFIYPDAPYFYKPNEVHFRSGSADDATEQSAPWNESARPSIAKAKPKPNATTTPAQPLNDGTK